MGADLPLLLVKINVKSDFQSNVEPIPAVDSILLWIRIQGIPITTLFTLIPTPIPSPAKNGIITALSSTSKRQFVAAARRRFQPFCLFQLPLQT